MITKMSNFKHIENQFISFAATSVSFYRKKYRPRYFLNSTTCKTPRHIMDVVVKTTKHMVSTANNYMISMFLFSDNKNHIFLWGNHIDYSFFQKNKMKFKIKKTWYSKKVIRHFINVFAEKRCMTFVKYLLSYISNQWYWFY